MEGECILSWRLFVVVFHFAEGLLFDCVQAWINTQKRKLTV